MHVDGVVGWPSVWLVKLDNLVGANEISELGLSIPVKLIASFSYWKQCKSNHPLPSSAVPFRCGPSDNLIQLDSSCTPQCVAWKCLKASSSSFHFKIMHFTFMTSFSKGIHATKVRDSQQGNTKMCVIFEYVPPPFHAPHRRHRASFDSSVKSMRAANGIGREIHASPCSRY
ncbi:uncharacterized protein CIMG_07162 [Coccidioides immitis RS]|uniref:Uncharacterized protein n=2 Tax=Coccidioides immitis TaxID=5501 RepID=A0A0E1RWE6_COCIM|nr:uncharacterized protein CIMG_07162 [Coccidioides immitis RS]EAS31683.1 hypothetical protein CIMG_07162 [Coccidioides immitis RS]KMU73476.1 hypothetical protein CISG_03611 [Coccidioides immitis RMSCC 3703]